MATPVKNEIKVSSEAFDELTGALNEKGIKLDSETSFTVTKDLAIKGPINYRQVNLRHALVTEFVKTYHPPKNEQGQSIWDNDDFLINFDEFYKYILTGELPEPEKPKVNIAVVPKPSVWK